MSYISFYVTGLSYNKSSLSWEMFINGITYPKDKVDRYPVEHIIHITDKYRKEDLDMFKSFLNDFADEPEFGCKIDVALDSKLVNVDASPNIVIAYMRAVDHYGIEDNASWDLACSRYDIEQITSGAIIDSYQSLNYQRFSDNREVIV